MKLHLGPFLEMHFYFADSSDHESLRRVLLALEEGGARYTGSALAHKGQPVFGAVNEHPRIPVSLSSLKEFDRYSYQNQFQIVQIGMHNASTLDSQSEEIISYAPISIEAAQNDQHPISIWADGSDFQNQALGAVYHQRLGHRFYSRFRWLCCALQPAYASISFNGSLPCPSDLQRSPNSWLFHDFFVNDSYLGIDSYSLFQEISPALYTEKIEYSSYISTSRFFNPFASCVDHSVVRRVSQRLVEAILEAKQRQHSCYAREALNQLHT